MVLKKEDRELLLRWLLRHPSGAYAPKFSEILAQDAEEKYASARALLRALQKDSASFLLYVQFIIDEKRFVLAIDVMLMKTAGELSVMLTERELVRLQNCALQSHTDHLE